MSTRQNFCLMLIFAGCSMLAADGVTRGKSANPDLAFDPDGSVSSLVVEAGGANLIDQSKPGRGFYVEVKTGDGRREYAMDVIERRGDILTLSGKRKPSLRFTFEVTGGRRYLALKLKRVEQLPQDIVALHLEMRCNSEVVMQGLNYMLDNSARGCEIRADWQYLHRKGGEPLGGIALYLGGKPEQEDEALLDIWVNEDFCRPGVKEKWDRERALQWLSEFENRYKDQTRMILAANSPEELYSLTDKAQRIGIKQIYLHTDTWRGEYWPVQHSHVHVNQQVFPRGVEDMKKYSGFLRERGMFLALHYTSGGIGPRDPERIAKRIDPGLCSWGAGTLEEPLTAEANVVRFRPDPAQRSPLAAEWGDGPPHNVNNIFSPMYVRVGKEIINVGAFQDTDKPVWTLTGCSRGGGATKAVPHPKGESMAGLFSAYGQNFIPDPDSTLLEDVAKEYASFANAIDLGRLEYDALEIHAIVPWGHKRFTELVTRYVDHPTITGCSGGCPVWGNTEVKFHRYKHLSGAGGATASFVLETGYRRASTELDFNIELCWAVANGENKLVLQKSEAMFGINEDMLAKHGLSGQFLDDFKRWRAVLDLLTPEQRDMMKKVISAPPSSKRTLVQGGGGSHTSMRIQETPDAYEIVPVTILARPTDAPWMGGTESAPIAPRQFILPGQSLQFNNPNATQPLKWTIRVLPEVIEATGPVSKVVATGANGVLDNYLTGVAGAQESIASAHPFEGTQWVWFGSAAPAASAGDKTVYFRKRIVIPPEKTLRVATLFFTADDVIDCYVNGKRVASNRTWEKVRSKDILSALQPGENLLALAATNGGGPGGCIACVYLCYDKEKPLVIPTDESWKATDRLADGWMSPEFNDAQWQNAVPFGLFGMAPWGKPALLLETSRALQPKATEVQNQKYSVFAQDGDGVVISASNPGDEDRWNERDLPFWMPNVGMPGHGLSLDVTGDNSGAMLVIQLCGGGERDYVVKIDFTGKRTLVIPTGEVAWADGRWGRRPGTERFGYDVVGCVRMGFGYLPAKSSAKVKVENLRLLEDRHSKLVDPIVVVGAGQLCVKGEIETGHYLRYTGGAEAGVYDENWKLVKNLPVTVSAAQTPSGPNQVTVQTPAGAPHPWLELQFCSEGEPICVRKH